MWNKEFLAMSITCFSTVFHITSFNGSLVIAVKSKAKCKCWADRILFHILQKHGHNKSFIYSELTFQDTKLSCSTFAPRLKS